jgi:hypothetical protein
MQQGVALGYQPLARRGCPGLCESIKYGVIVVSRHSQDDVMRGIDAIRKAC